MFDVSKAVSRLQPNERGNFFVEYIDAYLIIFLFHVLDKVKLSHTNSIDKAYKTLLNHVNQTLQESGYSQVNLAVLFYSLSRPKTEPTTTI